MYFEGIFRAMRYWSKSSRSLWQDTGNVAGKIPTAYFKRVFSRKRSIGAKVLSKNFFIINLKRLVKFLDDSHYMQLKGDWTHLISSK